MKGIFVTGTDTGVGKTFIAAGIAAALRRRGINVGVMKPVHTGCKTRNGRHLPEDSLLLEKAASAGDPLELITPYTFREAVSPYVAAWENNIIIDAKKLISSFKTLCNRHDCVIVEGIGGALVPITRDFYVADLIKAFKIPALIVTRPGLGTINHTLLTINCLKERKIPLKGIVINYSKRGKGVLSEKSCPATIEKLSGVPVIGVMANQSEKGADLPDLFLKLSDSLFDIRR